MKKIVIYYWHLVKFKNIDFEHGQEFDYSGEKLQELVMYIIELGYSIMIRNNKKNGCIVIWISDRGFSQS